MQGDIVNKILIVEDEQKLRDELKIFLENSGYSVTLITDFNDPILAILNKDVDLILLDINLPGLNGEAICKELRKKISIPIIMVTSRNSEIDEIVSINYGADDFITKPYNTQVLLARIERLLKRHFASPELIKYDDLYLDMFRSALIKDGKTIDLSKNEFKIFYYLVIHRRKIVSRDELMNYLWDTNEFIDDNTLTVNINRLRKRLNDIDYKDVIMTRRGQGYILL